MARTQKSPQRTSCIRQIVTQSYRCVYHGLPWFTMVYHGLPWFTMVYHGLPWFTMVYHGLPWFTMVYHGLPWFTMVYHGLPWFTMVYHGLPWFTMVYHGLPWFTMVYHGLPWFTMVYHGLPWFTMVYHGLPWFTMHLSASVCRFLPALQAAGTVTDEFLDEKKMKKCLFRKKRAGLFFVSSIFLGCPFFFGWHTWDKQLISQVDGC